MCVCVYVYISSCPQTFRTAFCLLHPPSFISICCHVNLEESITTCETALPGNTTAVNHEPEPRLLHQPRWLLPGDPGVSLKKYSFPLTTPWLRDLPSVLQECILVLLNICVGNRSKKSSNAHKHLRDFVSWCKKSHLISILRTGVEDWDLKMIMGDDHGWKKKEKKKWCHGIMLSHHNSACPARS